MREFVNTRDIEEDLDDIATPQALEGWVAEHGLGGGGATAADVTRFAEVREGLRALMLANNGEPLDAGSRGRMDAVAASVPLRFTLGGDATRSRWARGSTARSGRSGRVYASMRDRSCPRLKACRADDLRMGLLRPLAQPVGHVVLDGGVRKPRQGTDLSRAARQGQAKA